jgi:ATP-dependent Clp protease ATP-binding subunit ClpC
MTQETWLALAIVLGLGGLFAAAKYWQDRRTTGGTAPTSSFATDLTNLAARGTLDKIEGRDKEIERTLHILMRRTKNNPLLIGAPGVGKTAIVEGLAQKILAGDVPEALKGSRIVSMDLNAMMAETKYRGELEKRIKTFLDGLAAQGRTILFIDEFHMLAQVGAAEGAVNVSEVFKPALARGDLQIIGATTWDEYEKHIRPNAALDRRLQPVLVDEPSTEQAVRMLKALRPAYEEFHHVKIPDDAIDAAVRLSDEKIRGRFLPDKAIDLIDEAAAKVAIECSRSHHGATMGIVHEAARHAQDVVKVKDIEDVIDQWAEHPRSPLSPT